MTQLSVGDFNGIRSLYFGDGVLQSCIDLNKPEKLLMDYSKAMMCVLLFVDAPASVLLIGLGGGSLVHFLCTHFKNCRLEAVEIAGDVIDLAPAFLLSAERYPLFKIIHASGTDFVAENLQKETKYDLILIDAFDRVGPARALKEEFFLSSCKKLLTGKGVLVMNAWNGPDDNFPLVYQTVCNAFSGNALKFELGEVYRNAIIFGFADPEAAQDLFSFRKKTSVLGKAYGINFHDFLNRVIRGALLSGRCSQTFM